VLTGLRSQGFPPGRCPGCGGEVGPPSVCCDACWERVPRHLPGYPHWRARWAAAQRDGDWYADEEVEAIRDELLDWLRDNTVTTGSTR
jgi:hypothetical protein